ncbi:MAG: hypothetical protein ACE14T_11905 [Syntrophales bacterium]
MSWELIGLPIALLAGFVLCLIGIRAGFIMGRQGVGLETKQPKTFDAGDTVTEFEDPYRDHFPDRGISTVEKEK